MMKRIHCWVSLGVVLFFVGCGGGSAGTGDASGDAGAAGFGGAAADGLPPGTAGAQAPSGGMTGSGAGMGGAAGSGGGGETMESLCAGACAVTIEADCPQHPTMEDCVATCVADPECPAEAKDFYRCLAAKGRAAIMCDAQVGSIIRSGFCDQETLALGDCTAMSYAPATEPH